MSFFALARPPVAHAFAMVLSPFVATVHGPLSSLEAGIWLTVDARGGSGVNGRVEIAG
jgi:hypothetical protein